MVSLARTSAVTLLAFLLGTAGAAAAPVAQDPDLPAIADISAEPDRCTEGATTGKFFLSNGSAQCTDAPGAWTPRVGAVRAFAPHWVVASCPPEGGTTADCPASGATLFADLAVPLPVTDGPNADLRVYSDGSWTELEVRVDGQDSAVATIAADTVGTWADVELGDGSATQYSRIILRALFTDPAPFELRGVRALNGGTGTPLLGLTTQQQLFYLVDGKLRKWQSADPVRCTRGDGSQGKFFLPDGSGRCTDAPGVFHQLTGRGYVYIPTWTSATCDCAAEPYPACVVRNPAAFMDLRIAGTFELHDGPDIAITAAEDRFDLAAREFLTPSYGPPFTVENVPVEIDPGWQTALVFLEGPDPVAVLGTDADENVHTIDFGGSGIRTISQFHLRAFNGGTHCGGFAITGIAGLPRTTVPADTSGCGDGIRSGTEVCDGTELGEQTCRTLGYTGGTLQCSPSCKYATIGCTGTVRATFVPELPPPPTPTGTTGTTSGRCGDNVRNGTEICDGFDLAGRLCSSLGFSGGGISCKADCSGYDTSHCDGSAVIPVDECPPGTSCIVDDFSVNAPLSSPPTPPAQRVATALIGLSGGVALVFIILGGIGIITAGSDQEKLRKAKRTLAGAVIGMTLVILSYLIVSQALRIVYTVPSS